MKSLTTLLSVLLLFVVSAKAALPAGIESSLFQVQTNLHTNVTQIAQINTNNVVTNIVYQTNIWQSLDPVAPKPEVLAALKAATGDSPGGGAVYNIVLAILGAYTAWKTWQSNRRAKAAETLSQNLETSREVIKAQPGGEILDAKLVSEVRSQQVEAGVGVKEIASNIASNKVNPVEAKAAAARVVGQ